MVKKIWTVVLVVSCASLLLPVPWIIHAACGLIQALYLPGFVLLCFVGDDRRPRLDDLFLPLLLSPILLSVLVLAIHGVTGSLDVSITSAAWVFYALLLVAILARRVLRTGHSASIPNGVVWISLFFGGLVTVAYLVNGYLAVRSDAWGHLQIVNEVMDRGIPPMEPKLPDVPLKYMWLYHLFQASMANLTKLTVVQVFGIFNIMNAFAFPYLLARITALLSTDRAHTYAVPLFAIAGLSSAAWILWPIGLARAFFGDVRGTQEIARMVRAIHINGVDVIMFLTPYGTWLMNLIDKFLTITAFNYSLNLFLVCTLVVCERDFHNRARIRAAAIVFIVIAGTLLFHVVTGASLIGAAIGAGVISYFYSRIRRRTPPDAFHTVAVPATAVLAAAVVLPYFSSLMGGGGGGGIADTLRRYIGVSTRNLFTLIAPLIVLFPFVRRALQRLVASEREESSCLLSWIVMLAVLSIFIDLPAIGENKILFPFFLLLTVPVASQIVDTLRAASPARRGPLALWLAVLFVLPSVLTVRGFIMERPSKPYEIERHVLSGEEHALFEWIERNTPIDAVIIEKNTLGRMPVYSHRRNFYPSPVFISDLFYGGEKVRRYGAIHARLYSGEDVQRADVEYLRGTRMEYYIVVWKDDLVDHPNLETILLSHPQWFERVYENPAVSVYVLQRV